MPERFRLPNGLTVILEEQHQAKVCALQVWVKAGSADERPDQAGLAHVHEHMLFKGTQKRGPGEVAREIEAHGGEINAWTSFDQTVYHVVMASPFAEVGLDILADALRSSAFDEGELTRELEVICEEIKRSEDMPSRRASRDLFSTLFQHHPYGRPVIGWERTVRGFNRDKVLEFFHRHYTPRNLVLTAVGDLNPDDVLAWVEARLGGEWGHPYAGRVERSPEPPLEGRRIQLRADDAKELHLHLGFPIPPVSHEDVPALDVLAMLVGQGEASRLSLEVKRKRGLVNDISAYAYTPKDAGLFGVALTLPKEKAWGALEETARVLAQLRRHPVPDAELATMKALLESDAIYGRETVQGLARKLGYYETGVGGIEEEARYYERVAKLTPHQLLEVAQRYLRLDRLVVTGLLPEGGGLTSSQVEEVLNRTDRSPVPAPAPWTRNGPSLGGPLQVTRPLRAATGTGTGGVSRHTLSSGATLLIREESAVPLFAVRAVFQGGLRYETPTNNGLTSLLARTLTRGTPTLGAEDTAHLVDELQGSLSATGGRNSFSLRGEFLSKHFARAFDLFSECLQQPTFPEAEVERERQLTLQDILTREDKPAGLAFDLFHKTLFRNHPYRLNVLGEKASVEALTPAQLHAFHAQHMSPSKMVLCVVGDVDAEQVVAKAEAAFGKSRSPGITPKPDIPLEPPPDQPRVAHRTLARAQTHLVYGFQGVRVTDPRRRPLEVLSTLLSGQGGRLFVELRDKRSMAYSVTSYSVEGVDPGYFALYMGTSPEKVGAALAGMQEELRKVREEKVSEAELVRAQRHLVGTHEIGLQRNGARAALFALDELYGLGATSSLRYAEEVFAVTREEVLAVAQQLLAPSRSALAVVGPEPSPHP